jgi:hypothetical protein
MFHTCRPLIMIEYPMILSELSIYLLYVHLLNRIIYDRTGQIAKNEWSDYQAPGLE